MKYVYVGNGRFIHGVPARDLSEAEFAELDADLQDAVLTSGIYNVEEAAASDALEENHGA